jgi:hypothetical protein
MLVRGVLAGVAGVGLAACGRDDAPPDRAADPLADLRAAAVKTLSTSFRLTMSAPRVRVAGDVDPVGQKMTLDVDVREADGTTVRQRIRLVGADAYLMLGRAPVADVDPTKYIQFTAPSTAFTNASALDLADPYDPAGIKTVGFAFTAARRTADGAFAGRLDLTKALPTTSRGLLPADPVARRAGDVVTDIPYEATVAGGFLTSVTVRVPAIGPEPAYATTSRYADFDDPVDVTRPESSEITEASEALRELLAG